MVRAVLPVAHHLSQARCPHLLQLIQVLLLQVQRLRVSPLRGHPLPVGDLFQPEALEVWEVYQLRHSPFRR